MMDKRAGLKTKILFIILIILAIHLYRSGYLSTEMLGWKAKDTVSGYAVKENVVYDNASEILVHFCPAENCSYYLEKEIMSAKRSVHCAFFDLNLQEIISALSDRAERMDVKLVVDDGNYEDVSHLDFAKQDTTGQYSHNKFCVIDGNIVTSGSMNPTFNDNYRNNNNLVVLRSSKLAENYEAEFAELWNLEFGKGKTTKNPIVILGNMTVKNYFCPEDWCANKIIDELALANESVYFMAFSFTSEPISRKLIELQQRNVSVHGIMEKQQTSKYDKYDEMLSAGIDVMWDGNKYKMHHKFFVIDEKVVVTGSMNPTGSGDDNNDENILVIYDERLAKQYLDEFAALS